MDTKKLRQKILDLAIRGRLVPQDPNDEPASVLLERIRAEKERLIKEGKIKRSKKSASDTPHYENKTPFEVPEGWEWVRLEDYLLLLSGQDYPPQKYNSDHRGIPYIIGASNIENEQLSINRWTDEPSVISTLNDVLVVCKGAGVGKIAMNNVGDVHIARQIQAIRDETGIINSKYIKLCIASNISEIIANANGLIPGLKRELLLSLIIPVAPIEEQERIVNAVEQWYTLVSTLEKETNDLSARIRQTKSKILDLAIHGKLVPQDPSDEPAIELLKRINPKFTPCDNAHYPFDVPHNWVWARGVDIFKPMKAASPLGDTFKYIDIDAIDNKRNVVTSVKVLNTKQAPSRASRYTEKGCVLFSMVRPYLRNIAMVTEDDCIASTGFFVCQGKGCLSSKFCYFQMLSNYVVDGLNDFMKGDNSPSITKAQIEEYIFPLPPLNEQERIVTKIEELFAVLDEIQKSIEA